MAYTVTLIPGDGIGPEVVGGRRARARPRPGSSSSGRRSMAGAGAIGEHGNALPPDVLESVRTNKLALKGPTATPVGTGYRSVNVELRKTLDLYANLRPVRDAAGRQEPLRRRRPRRGAREHRGPLQRPRARGGAGRRGVDQDHHREGLARASRRFAFEYARTHGRKRITAVHKANIMKLSDGLFLDCCRKVAKDYPEITYDEMIVDNTLHAARPRPDALRHAAAREPLRRHRLRPLRRASSAAWAWRPGANIGESVAVFEAVHGSAPDIAGQEPREPDGAHPLRGHDARPPQENDAAARVRKAVHAVLAEGKKLTRDLGGTAGTTEIAEAIAARL